MSSKLELAAIPPLSPEMRAALDAMTPEEIERNAKEDPDNPPMTEEEDRRGHFGRRVRRLREKLGMSRAEFAARYRIEIVRLEDWEWGRVDPDSAIEAYLTLIEAAPNAVASRLDRSERTAGL